MSNMPNTREVTLCLRCHTRLARFVLRCLTPLVIVGLMSVDTATSLAERFIRVSVEE